FRAREGCGIVGELLMRPAADVVDPFTRSEGFSATAKHLDCLLSRFHPIEPAFSQPGRRGTQKVHVVIDQAGDNGSAFEIDPYGVRSGEAADVLVRASGYDVVAADRDRLRNGKP